MLKHDDYLLDDYLLPMSGTDCNNTRTKGKHRATFHPLHAEFHKQMKHCKDLRTFLYASICTALSARAGTISAA